MVYCLLPLDITLVHHSVQAKIKIAYSICCHHSNSLKAQIIITIFVQVYNTGAYLATHQSQNLGETPKKGTAPKLKSGLIFELGLLLNCHLECFVNSLKKFHKSSGSKYGPDTEAIAPSG